MFWRRGGGRRLQRPHRARFGSDLISRLCFVIAFPLLCIPLLSSGAGHKLEGKTGYNFGKPNLASIPPDGTGCIYLPEQKRLQC